MIPRPPIQPPPPLFQQHSDTSRAAADRIKPSAGTLRNLVLGHLIAHPDGLTDEEMQEQLSMNPSTERPRRIELVEAGCVRNSGRTRKTRSNRDATVWVAVKP